MGLAGLANIVLILKKSLQHQINHQHVYIIKRALHSLRDLGNYRCYPWCWHGFALMGFGRAELEPVPEWHLEWLL
jgi:hypothetical protein